MANVELARKAIEAIERSPEAFNQDFWHCGTTMCFAGFVAMCTDAQWAAEYDTLLKVNGELIHVGDYAQDILEIDRETANMLFYHCDNIDDLKGVIETLEPGPLESEGIPS
jgi:hypothetical protein